MPDTGGRDLDDTVETSLADDLLSGGADRPTEEDEEDEEGYLGPGRRSRLTTGLLVLLIFAVGVLCGVLLGRALTPTPPPRIVYLLNDAGPSASTPSAPTPPAPTHPTATPR